uniref:Uncharacterized protein n=1 Tax=Lepeophtheirus salmonis TaxID=72036 RepID=A0A0K2T670_LEPSM
MKEQWMEDDNYPCSSLDLFSLLYCRFMELHSSYM